VQNNGATGPSKKFDDIFSRVDTIHTNGRRTPYDSEDRAYAYRRAVIKRNHKCR